MFMTIDHEGPVPLYRQLADLLRTQIADGTLMPNRPIPTEQRLMHEHEVGRDTVRKAIAILREEGFVIAIQGRGTFVALREN
ncbi:GntR family transcriptional regulator [Nonomuraea sp. NEAU-A123]|uniref:GntR family transcriptional regulator n=1 Tax=Nonomuraea sp. NEAU-A123 TaxID=2839649 RepID=UPI001BE3F6D0|nr:winged helix-turn-helix domain-containing protein [Nonomuraea sp. NEAU-A123]MBT2235071.1 winged helix-turn-helix domain-containing protein [Nonomuraea sp. NEAU-A123]